MKRSPLASGRVDCYDRGVWTPRRCVGGADGCIIESLDDSAPCWRWRSPRIPSIRDRDDAHVGEAFCLVHVNRILEPWKSGAYIRRVLAERLNAIAVGRRTPGAPSESRCLGRQMALLAVHEGADRQDRRRGCTQPARRCVQQYVNAPAPRRRAGWVQPRRRSLDSLPRERRGAPSDDRQRDLGGRSGVVSRRGADRVPAVRRALAGCTRPTSTAPRSCSRGPSGKASPTWASSRSRMDPW